MVPSSHGFASPLAPTDTLIFLAYWYCATALVLVAAGMLTLTHSPVPLSVRPSMTPRAAMVVVTAAIIAASVFFENYAIWHYPWAYTINAIFGDHTIYVVER